MDDEILVSMGSNQLKVRTAFFTVRHMKLQMDTEFKPLLIVNVPSGLTPSSSIASAPFCVCVCPM